MAQGPNADDLKRLSNLSVMPAEKVYFAQSYVDRKTGTDGRPLASSITWGDHRIGVNPTWWVMDRTASERHSNHVGTSQESALSTGSVAGARVGVLTTGRSLLHCTKYA